MSERPGVRIEKVEVLTAAMVEALHDHPETLDSNVTEIVSAAMTLCLRIVTACIARGADPASIRRGLDTIYIACAGDVVH